MFEPTYYVAHPDGTYSVADPQPVMQEPVAWMWACTECGTEAEDGTDGRICSSCGYHKFYKAPKDTAYVCEARAQEQADILSKSLKRIQSLERQLKIAQQQWDNSREYALELAERLFKYEEGSPMRLNSEQAEQKPVAWALSHLMGLEFGSKYPMQETKEAAEQMARQHMGAVVVTPLYAAPVRTKDLTDEQWTQSELFKLAVSRGLLTLHTEFVAAPVDTETKVSWMEGHATSCDISNEAARAVIAKFKEKNK